MLKTGMFLMQYDVWTFKGDELVSYKQNYEDVDSKMLDALVSAVGKSSRQARPPVDRSLMAKIWWIFARKHFVSLNVKGWIIGIGIRLSCKKNKPSKELFTVKFVSPKEIESRDKIFKLQRQIADLKFEIEGYKSVERARGDIASL